MNKQLFATVIGLLLVGASTSHATELNCRESLDQVELQSFHLGSLLGALSIPLSHEEREQVQLQVGPQTDAVNSVVSETAAVCLKKLKGKNLVLCTAAMANLSKASVEIGKSFAVSNETRPDLGAKYTKSLDKMVSDCSKK